MTILVPTIPHTGTHFVRDHLLLGLDTHVEHIWPESMDTWRTLFALRPPSPIVIPLRHPFAVARSWKRREKDVFELPDWWSRLVHDVPSDTRTCYLPLDSPDRERWLEDLNTMLGTELVTDWRIVREGPQQYRGDAVPLNNRETASVQATLDALAPFFSRFWKL